MSLSDFNKSRIQSSGSDGRSGGSVAGGGAESSKRQERMRLIGQSRKLDLGERGLPTILPTETNTDSSSLHYTVYLVFTIRWGLDLNT